MTVPSNAQYASGTGVVTGDQLNTFVQTCSTAAQLRSFIGVSGMNVSLLGISAANDGYGGVFWWNASSTASDDNINTIVPNGVVVGGWNRVTTVSSVPTVTLSGDVTGSGTTAITTTLATVNSNVGTFQGITVNAKGQVTAASNQSYVTAPVTVAQGGLGTTATPTNGQIPIGNGTLYNAASITAGAGVSITNGASAITVATTAGTINAQTGTSYAIQNGDNNALITFSNAAATAVTIAQAGNAGNFASGWWVDVENKGAGLVTVTPTTSTIGQVAAVYLATGFAGRIYSDGTNYQFVSKPALYTLASSAISNWLPGVPTAALGGNSRGVGAFDFQQSRALATQVASGLSSIALGRSNTASASTAIAIGDSNSVASANSAAIGLNNSITTGANANVFGNGNTVGNGSTAAQTTVTGYNLGVTGQNSFVAGSTMNTSGTQVVVTGFKGDDRGNFGAIIRSTIALGTSGVKYGRSQIEEYTFVNTTSGATAVRLTTDGAAAGAANIGNLGTNQNTTFTVDVNITDTTTGKMASYSLAQSLIYQGANAAATTLVLNGGGVVAGPASASPFTLQAAPTVTVDTTNGGLNISYQPPAANTDTFYAQAVVRYNTLRAN
jgi:hypothetical protein